MKCHNCKIVFKKEEISYYKAMPLCQKCWDREKNVRGSKAKTPPKKCDFCGTVIHRNNKIGLCLKCRFSRNDCWAVYNKETDETIQKFRLLTTARRMVLSFSKKLNVECGFRYEK